MPISPSKTRILLTIDKELLAWVDAQAKAEYRDRNNWIIAQILKIKEVSPMKNLISIYTEWRKVSEEMLADGYKGSLDCGETRVREDFSSFAELPEVITFEEMFKLEKQYK